MKQQTPDKRRATLDDEIDGWQDMTTIQFRRACSTVSTTPARRAELRRLYDGLLYENKHQPPAATLASVKAAPLAKNKKKPTKGAANGRK